MNPLCLVTRDLRCDWGWEGASAGKVKTTNYEKKKKKKKTKRDRWYSYTYFEQAGKRENVSIRIHTKYALEPATTKKSWGLLLPSTPPHRQEAGRLYRSPLQENPRQARDAKGHVFRPGSEDLKRADAGPAPLSTKPGTPAVQHTRSDRKIWGGVRY